MLVVTCLLHPPRSPKQLICELAALQVRNTIIASRNQHGTNYLPTRCCPPRKQVTVFTALLAMDLNRQNAGKMDWCCCFTSKAYLEASARLSSRHNLVSVSLKSSLLVDEQRNTQRQVFKRLVHSKRRFCSPPYKPGVSGANR